MTITVVLNNPPTFTGDEGYPGAWSRSKPAGTNVGSAGHGDRHRPGRHADLHAGRRRRGGVHHRCQAPVKIQTKRPSLDQETKSKYTVTVTATDTLQCASDAITVTITVTDVTFGCATDGAVAASNTDLVSDCEALLEARNKLEDGGARLNWWQGTPIADWEGITLRGTPARVAWVDLRAKGLSGTVPAELGQLSMLTYLNLRSNDLTGDDTHRRWEDLSRLVRY